MQIGGIPLAEGAAFAPMAGVSDLAMRRLCARYGAVFTVSEMVSAKAVTMKDKNTRKLYAGGGGEAPFGVQLFGYEPEVMEQAVQMLEGEPFDFVDINMGCPAPKIVGHGAGSALLKNPLLAEEMARAAVKAGSRPVTVKLRIGWDSNTLTGLEIARRCEAAGVSLLAVHGRTQAQMYAPGVNFEAVAQIKRAVSIPVLYNGDVTGGAAALEALQKTGCDGVMVGRGAMGAPWVFAEIKAALQGQPLPAPFTLRQRFALLDEQIRGMCEDKGEGVALRQGRGVAIAYMRGLKGAAALRRQAGALTHYTDLAGLIESAYEYNS